MDLFFVCASKQATKEGKDFKIGLRRLEIPNKIVHLNMIYTKLKQ